MSSLLSFMNSSHSNRNRSTDKATMYYKKDVVKDNLALPTINKLRTPTSLSSALSKVSLREGLPNVSPSSVKSILSPREASSLKDDSQSALRKSAMALLTTPSSSSPSPPLSSSTALSNQHRHISSSISSNATRVSPRSNFSTGLLTTISNNIIGRPSPPPATNNTLVCDKCDGKHETVLCPYFKKERDAHPDAQKNFYQKLGGKSSLPGQMLTRANVIRQPGDGSCLFHSMSYGLGDTNATKLRAEICAFIQQYPDLKICETPLSDWIKWDSNCTPAEYSRKMRIGSWGGGIEMAITSYIKKCNVHVYEKHLGNFKRISAFDYPDIPEQRKIIRVLYQGGVHYDALQQN